MTIKGRFIPAFSAFIQGIMKREKMTTNSGTKTYAVAFFIVVSLFLTFPGRAFAWATNQSAQAFCDGATAKIKITFTNTEVKNQNVCYEMNVTVTDTKTGQSVQLGKVIEGQTKTATINTSLTSLSSESVIFNLTWADGRVGNDTRSAYYSDINCSVSPTPTATPTPRRPRP